MSAPVIPAVLERAVAYGGSVRRLWRLPFALSYCAPARWHVMEWAYPSLDTTLHMAVADRGPAEWIGDMRPLHLSSPEDFERALAAIRAAEVWTVTEFFGRGDPMFGGAADDRPLGWDGRFVTGSYVPHMVTAWFPSREAAQAAAEAAPNRRPGGLITPLRARHERIVGA